MNFDKSTLQLEASASVDADVCVGRYGTCLITLLVPTNSNKNRKEQNFDIEVLLFSLVEGHLQGGALVPSAPTKIMVHFYTVGALETSAPPEVALNSEKFTLP